MQINLEFMMFVQNVCYELKFRPLCNKCNNCSRYDRVAQSILRCIKKIFNFILEFELVWRVEQRLTKIDKDWHICLDVFRNAVSTDYNSTYYILSTIVDFLWCYMLLHCGVKCSVELNLFQSIFVLGLIFIYISRDVHWMVKP